MKIYLHKDFGDFQTPLNLVNQILKKLKTLNKNWTRILEPTCGTGNFIKGITESGLDPNEIQGIEIQEEYVDRARELSAVFPHITVHKNNIFDLNLSKELSWANTGPLLVIGNPPWITNSELGSINSSNIPKKRNLKSLNGFDALTGASNFDIAEYIWLKLISELEENTAIALLSKTSVARNILQFAHMKGLPIRNAKIFKINTKEWFGASVDGCLFYLEIGKNEDIYFAEVFSDLESITPDNIIVAINGYLVTCNNLNDISELLSRKNDKFPFTWRQGIKHDAASVMELTYNSMGYKNKLGETVDIEDSYLFPLIKSSDLYNKERQNPTRAVIITQNKLSEDTGKIEKEAPRLWSYLTSHEDYFIKRKSSIYKGKLRFSIFGVGDYSFAPYKVAISGFYKNPRFRAFGPVDKKPVVFDDTCYFIPCNSELQAALLSSILNHPVSIAQLKSLIFIDSKRPITKKVLQNISLTDILKKIDDKEILLNLQNELSLMNSNSCDISKITPQIIKELLIP